MKIIFLSTDMNIVDEWISKLEIDTYISCDDLESLNQTLSPLGSEIIIADYDTMSSEINKLISSSTLQQKLVILEKAPEILTGKMLISRGISAYGNSRMLSNHLKQIISAIEEDKIWTYPELTAAIAKRDEESRLSKDAKKLIKKRLSEKELKVIYLVLDGFTNDAIANKLNITNRTVKAHISTIFSKLHVNDRVSLILLLR